MMSLPCALLLLIPLAGYVCALAYQQWFLAFVCAIGMAAVTFLGGATPWNIVYVAGLIPLAAWYCAHRQRPKVAAPRREFITRPDCSCPACRPGADA